MKLNEWLNILNEIDSESEKTKIPANITINPLFKSLESYDQGLRDAPPGLLSKVYNICNKELVNIKKKSDFVEYAKEQQPTSTDGDGPAPIIVLKRDGDAFWPQGYSKKNGEYCFCIEVMPEVENAEYVFETIYLQLYFNVSTLKLVASSWGK